MEFYTVNILCPNLNYRNGELWFVSKHPIKLLINNKKEFRTDFSLGKNIALKSSINIFDYDISCTIIEKTFEKGLKINLKYKKEYNIPKYELHKIGFYLETLILNINNDDDYFEDEIDEIDESQSNKSNINNYYDDVDYHNNNTYSSTIKDSKYQNEEEEYEDANDDYYYSRKWGSGY